jgi:branched-chain amino acid transport system substrate-binding protein
LAETLRSRTWETALGPIAFDAKGDLTTPAFVVYKTRRGRFHAITRLR